LPENSGKDAKDLNVEKERIALKRNSLTNFSGSIVSPFF
jgi:hypothetical protein